MDFLTRLDASPAPQCYNNRLERVRTFARLFLDLDKTAATSEPSASSDPPLPPIATLVRQLHEALDKEESFRVTIYDSMGSHSSLKLLAQPLKFRLTRVGPFEDKEEEKMYQQPESLLIEPLANVDDIAQFVWQYLIPQKISAAASANDSAQRQMLKQQRQQQFQQRLQQKREEQKKKQAETKESRKKHRKEKKKAHKREKESSDDKETEQAEKEEKKDESPESTSLIGYCVLILHFTSFIFIYVFL